MQELTEIHDKCYPDQESFYIEAALRYLKKHGYDLDDSLDILDSAMRMHIGLTQTSVCYIEATVIAIGIA